MERQQFVPVVFVLLPAGIDFGGETGGETTTQRIEYVTDLDGIEQFGQGHVQILIGLSLRPHILEQLGRQDEIALLLHDVFLPLGSHGIGLTGVVITGMAELPFAFILVLWSSCLYFVNRELF